MLPSVQLYDHFLFKVHKIHNISPNWLLATKLETLLSAYLSDLGILVSTITPTGARIVADRLAGTAVHRYFPLDLPGPERGCPFLCPVCLRVAWCYNAGGVPA